MTQRVKKWRKNDSKFNNCLEKKQRSKLHKVDTKIWKENWGFGLKTNVYWDATPLKKPSSTWLIVIWYYRASKSTREFFQ